MNSGTNASHSFTWNSAFTLWCHLMLLNCTCRNYSIDSFFLPWFFSFSLPFQHRRQKSTHGHAENVHELLEKKTAKSEHRIERLQIWRVLAVIVGQPNRSDQFAFGLTFQNKRVQMRTTQCTLCVVALLLNWIKSTIRKSLDLCLAKVLSLHLDGAFFSSIFPRISVYGVSHSFLPSVLALFFSSCYHYLRPFYFMFHFILPPHKWLFPSVVHFFLTSFFVLRAV